MRGAWISASRGALRSCIRLKIQLMSEIIKWIFHLVCLMPHCWGVKAEYYAAAEANSLCCEWTIENTAFITAIGLFEILLSAIMWWCNTQEADREECWRTLKAPSSSVTFIPNETFWWKDVAKSWMKITGAWKVWRTTGRRESVLHNMCAAASQPAVS